MSVDAKMVQQLREQTGAGMMDAKRALEENGGDLTVATEVLRKQGLVKAAKKLDRTTGEGLIHAYIHSNGKIGAMVQVLCETDFVARTEQFQEFAHDIAMQVAATSPLYISPEDVPEDVVAKEREIAKEEIVGKPAEVIEKIVEGKMGKYFADVCLLKQPFIKDEDIMIEEHVKNTIAKLGENIQISRFERFALN